MSKKSTLYSKLLYESGHNFLDIQYSVSKFTCSVLGNGVIQGPLEGREGGGEPGQGQYHQALDHHPQCIFVYYLTLIILRGGGRNKLSHATQKFLNSACVYT